MRWLLAGLLSVLMSPLLAQPPLPKGVIAVTPRAAPDFALQDLDGGRFSLAAQRGRWVFVHFWASWCGPCRKEIPAIQRLVEKMRDAPLAMAMVNTAEDEDTVFDFIGVLAPDIVPLLDRDGQVTEQWRPRGLPSTYLVDPRGVIRYQVIGGQAWDEAPYVDFLRALPAGP